MMLIVILDFRNLIFTIVKTNKICILLFIQCVMERRICFKNIPL